MQPTKDSFYIALRDRLAALDPARTVAVDGVLRPAVLVAENEPADASPALPNAFYLTWGAAQTVKGTESARRPLMSLECVVSYRAPGTLAGGVDRGRMLAALDTELLRLTTPPRVAKSDYSQSPAVPLGSMIFWGAPEFSEVQSVHDTGVPSRSDFFRDAVPTLRRSARLLIFFFPEVDQA